MNVVQATPSGMVLAVLGEASPPHRLQRRPGRYYDIQIGCSKYEALFAICRVYDDGFGIELDGNYDISFSCTTGEPANKRRQ